MIYTLSYVLCSEDIIEKIDRNSVLKKLIVP